MPTYEELVYAIHIFLHEIQSHTTPSKIATGGEVAIPAILIEFADLRRFDSVHEQHIDWEKKNGFKGDYGQDAYEAFMTLRELCARAMQYGGEVRN